MMVHWGILTNAPIPSHNADHALRQFYQTASVFL